MQLRTRYQILKDFLFYYGCVMSVIYALQIVGDLLGKKLPYIDAYQNPYAFFAAFALILIVQPHADYYGRPKTFADYFPNAEKE